MDTAVRVYRRKLPPNWSPSRLPPGAILVKWGPGWTVYYDPSSDRTYLIYASREGLVEEMYKGKALPPCCR